jgi:hypothetical protein
MQSGADFIDRTLAALEGGYPLADDDRNRLLFAFTEYRTDPNAQLDKLLGLRPGRGQCSIASSYLNQNCARLIQSFYDTYYEGSTPTAAAKDIDFNFDELARNRADPAVGQHHKELYDAVVAAKGKVLKWRAIYNALQPNR